MKTRNVLLLAAFFAVTTWSAPAFATNIPATDLVIGTGLKPGLSGQYWNPPAGTAGTAGVGNTIAWMGANSPQGTFVGTLINYSGGDMTTPVNFLNYNGNTDGNSFVGTNGNLNDGLFELKGFYQAPVGTVNFSVGHDDDAQLQIGSTVLTSGGCCGTNTASATFSAAGLYPITLIYANASYNGGTGGASFNVSDNPGLTFLGQGGNIFQAHTPEPSSFVLCGLGAAGLLLAARRRNRKA